MTTRVINIRSGKPFDIYIGRKCGGFPESKWANPFKIGRDGTREDVIAKYRSWILDSGPLMKSLPELKRKTLGCWCKPLPCHGDVLIELAENMEKEAV